MGNTAQFDPTPPRLTPAQIDRACGAILGSAVGDALGAGYEFGSARVPANGPEMIGGGLGNFAPGQWTDDTSMAHAILEVAASDLPLTSPDALTAIARNFWTWQRSNPPDMGIQTRSVLAAGGPQPSANDLTTAARDYHRMTGRSGGNGSLMRTGPVALPLLNENVSLTVFAARRISDLTHADDAAWQACVLWTVAIRHAILTGDIDIRQGLKNLQPGYRDYWIQRIHEAENKAPSWFTPNGWVVTAFQAAWSAIHHTLIPGRDACRHFEDTLATAIGIGNDTDTVAAIAGALLGARWGASAIPARWRRVLHGYPGITGERLVELATLAANRGPINHDWPMASRIDYSRYGARGTITQHPHDPGVYLADAGALDALPDQADAVVSLCLIGQEQISTDREWISFRLIDRVGDEFNPNLLYVLTDAAATIKALRDEGKKVLVHCAAGQSRTPTVAIAYSLLLGERLATARQAVLDAVRGARPNPTFEEALHSLEARRSA